jgi:pimeloyl-ACP methyl ester carboxylesterase
MKIHQPRGPFLALWFFALCLTLTGCEQSEKVRGNRHTKASAWQLTDCPFAMASNIVCGKLRVPENWGKPGKTIISRVAIAKAANQAGKRSDPIVFLTGGPGISAFKFVDYLASLPMAKDRDMIIVEPRGYGYAEPALLCEPQERADMALCAKRLTAKGIDLTQYGTENMVRDLEALRDALKLKQWNVFGVSYGTFSASHYARMFPGSIRTLLLDSPYPPGSGFLYGYNASLNSFDLVFEHCEADPACNAAYPDLKSRFVAALQSLEKAPVTLNGEKIDGGAAFEAIYYVLYETHSFLVVPKLVDALARRDFGTIFGPSTDTGTATTNATKRVFDESRTSADGILASITCSEIVQLPVAANREVALKAPWPEDIVKLARPEGWNFVEMCEQWKIARAPARLAEHVVSNIPTLVLVGTFDPTTPPEMGEAYVKGWPQAPLFEHPGAAHVVIRTGDTCIYKAIATLLETPRAQLDRSCLVNAKRPVWEVETKSAR